MKLWILKLPFYCKLFQNPMFLLHINTKVAQRKRLTLSSFNLRNPVLRNP